MATARRVLGYVSVQQEMALVRWHTRARNKDLTRRETKKQYGVFRNTRGPGIQMINIVWQAP